MSQFLCLSEVEELAMFDMAVVTGGAAPPLVEPPDVESLSNKSSLIMGSGSTSQRDTILVQWLFTLQR